MRTCRCAKAGSTSTRCCSCSPNAASTKSRSKPAPRSPVHSSSAGPGRRTAAVRRAGDPGRTRAAAVRGPAHRCDDRTHGHAHRRNAPHRPGRARAAAAGSERVSAFADHFSAVAADYASACPRRGQTRMPMAFNAPQRAALSHPMLETHPSLTTSPPSPPTTRRATGISRCPVRLDRIGRAVARRGLGSRLRQRPGQPRAGVALRSRACHRSQRRAGRAGARARQHHLRGRTGRALRLPDASVDAVCVAQALHWFDRAAFFAQCARVLKPGRGAGGMGLPGHRSTGATGRRQRSAAGRDPRCTGLRNGR